MTAEDRGLDFTPIYVEITKLKQEIREREGRIEGLYLAIRICEGSDTPIERTGRVDTGGGG